MRQVRTCDFCGDDATGLYEPLPDSVPDSPRLLLCDGCRDQLGSLIDPLVAQLEDRSRSSSADTTGRPSPRDAPTEAPDGGATPDQRASREASPAEPDHPESSVVGESRDAGGRSQTERGGTPHGYRKVMRLLENRQLPMPRDDAEQLAMEAYELEPDEVAKVIDHAVEYGRIREIDGQLKQ